MIIHISSKNDTVKVSAPAYAFNPFYGQLAVLGTLIIYASLSGRFPILPSVACMFFVAATATQYVCCRLWHKAFSPLAALITACSLTLLMRTDSLSAAAVAACVAIASKFMIRVNGAHIFNPANVALAVVPLLGFSAWISPGQWGQDVYIVLLLACCGTAITGGVRRVEGATVFLAGYAAALFIRAAYYHDPMAIPLHQLQNAGLILFAFFMLSDPKTTPEGRGENIMFSCAVLAVTLVLQFEFTIPGAFIYALCAVCALRGLCLCRFSLMHRVFRH